MRRWHGSYKKWTTRFSDGCFRDRRLTPAGDGHAICRLWAIGRSSSGIERVARLLKQYSVLGAACAAEVLSCFAKGLLRFHCVNWICAVVKDADHVTTCNNRSLCFAPSLTDSSIEGFERRVHEDDQEYVRSLPIP